MARAGSTGRCVVPWTGGRWIMPSGAARPEARRGWPCDGWAEARRSDRRIRTAAGKPGSPVALRLDGWCPCWVRCLPQGPAPSPGPLAYRRLTDIEPHMDESELAHRRPEQQRGSHAPTRIPRSGTARVRAPAGPEPGHRVRERGKGPSGPGSGGSRNVVIGAVQFGCNGQQVGYGAGPGERERHGRQARRRLGVEPLPGPSTVARRIGRSPMGEHATPGRFLRM